MKKAAGIFALLVVLLAGYVAAGPYLTVSAIKTALVEQDSEKLADHVDFPVLRRNLKDQLNAFMTQKLADEFSDNPLAGFAVVLGARMIDGMVDALITPANLARAMEGRKAARSLRDANTDPPPKKSDLFRNARYSYDSLSRCSVYVPTGKGEETRFVFQRSWLTWKLSNLILPLDENP